MEFKEYQDDNRAVLENILYLVLKKYKTIIIVNDAPENIHIAYQFFNKFCEDYNIGELNFNIVEPEKTYDYICSRKHGDNSVGASCKIQQYVTVKTSNLSIYPCYKCINIDNLKYGSISTDMILYPENIELAFTMYSYNPSHTNPKCDRCDYRLICKKDCYIDRYKKNKDFLLPIEDNCKIYKNEILNTIFENDWINDFRSKFTTIQKIEESL